MKWVIVFGFLFLFAMMAHASVEQCVASVWNSRESSWGNVTASGIFLNDRGLAIAHKTAELGGFLKITNVANGRSIAMQVIDRGPYFPGRCVDLSEGAAAYLGIKGLGVVKVEEYHVASR